MWGVASNQKSRDLGESPGDASSVLLRRSRLRCCCRTGGGTLCDLRRFVPTQMPRPRWFCSSCFLPSGVIMNWFAPMLVTNDANDAGTQFRMHCPCGIWHFDIQLLWNVLQHHLPASSWRIQHLTRVYNSNKLLQKHYYFELLPLYFPPLRIPDFWNLRIMSLCFPPFSELTFEVIKLGRRTAGRGCQQRKAKRHNSNNSKVTCCQ